jgi:dienelactone hydrolase
MLKPHALPGLLTLRTPEGDLPIASSAQWRRKQGDIKARYWRAFGTPPDTRPPLCPEVLTEEDTGPYLRRKVRYQVEPDEYAPAWLLIPKGEPSPGPAMLCMHGTTRFGKNVPAGVAGDSPVFYAIAHELVQRGFVCLAADSICAGERVYEGYEPFETEPFFQLHPEWSAMGKMLWDHQAALSYLQTLDCVDGERLGCIGHSLGGYNSFSLGVFDERIKVVVASCAYEPFAVDETPKRWCRDGSFVHFEPLRAVLDAGEHPDFLWVEVLAAVAPRPLFYNVATQDVCFPHGDAVLSDMEELRQFYQLLGVETNFEVYVHEGDHAFPPAARERAYEMVERALRADRH